MAAWIDNELISKRLGTNATTPSFMSLLTTKIVDVVLLEPESSSNPLIELSSPSFARTPKFN